MRRLFLIIAAIAVIVAAGVAAGPAHAQQGQTYIVQPGDSLFAIAARFNVSVSELATINKIYDVNSVFVGQVLVLPASLPAGSGFGTGGAVTNPVTQPASRSVAQPPVVAQPGVTVTTVTTYSAYTVQPGDFLTGIAARFGTTAQAILATNPILDPNVVYVGQRLIIPRTRTTVTGLPAASSSTATGRLYVVQPGDNLFSIAARFRKNAWDLARANGILDLNAIYAGQALVIP